MKQFKNNFTIL